MTNLLTIFIVSFLQLLNAENEIQLTFCGDAMQHLPQIENARKNGDKFDYSECFKYLYNDINDADLALVNLETTLGGIPYSGYPCFSAPEDFAKELKRTGFDIFLTANNHCLDRRDKGLIRTIERLNDMSIPHIGTYRNKVDRDTANAVIKNIKGIKFAFLGYTYGTNGIPIQGNVVVNHLDRKQISEDIKTLRKKGVEIICVNLHWGIEYQLLPSKEQISLSDFLIEEGVDLIIGGHPHVVQPMKIVHSDKWNKDILVVYSMGNFISNQTDTNCRGGAMVKVTLKKDSSQTKLAEANYKLFFVQKPSRIRPYYQLIPSDREELILPNSKPEFNLFLKNARALFKKHNIGVSECN